MKYAMTTLLTCACLHAYAGVGECDPHEALEWDAVADATQYVLFANTCTGGPWVAIATLQAHAPAVDPTIEPTPRTWAVPALHFEVNEGACVAFAVGHDGTPVDPAPGGIPTCTWRAPCAMGFGTDPREDMLACAGVPTSLKEDRRAAVN